MPQGLALRVLPVVQSGATGDNHMKPFLIAGGGIGGFAAALALARKGLESIIIEREAELREAGAGIQLGPNVFRMFDVYTSL